MNTAKNMRHGIVQHNRHAIRRKNRQHQARIPSDKRIRLGHPLVNRERASPPIVGGNDPHSGAMHLPRKHELPEVSAHRPSHPPPILEHSPRVIPDSKTQIQRLVGAHRHPATPASNERLNSQPLERRPAQNVNPGNPAQRAGSRPTGGSSIYGLGNPPNEPRGWQTSLRHPRDSRQTVQVVYLKNESMSTSGNYEKFFRAEGKIYSHIMDPRTGYPAQGTLSASVVAPRTLDSEAWTKPYFINGREWAAKHKQKDFRVFVCEDRSELACEWVQ